MEAVDPELNYNELQNLTHSSYFSTQEFLNLTKSNDMLKIINYNIRSFQKNSDVFLPLMHASEPHVLILTETWFSENYQADIPNFNSHHVVRSTRPSGGASIYVNKDLPSRKIQNLCYVNDTIEVCVVEVIINKEPIIMIGVYRPHSGTIEDFTNELEILLQNRIVRNKRCCMAGDFNIDLLQDNDVNTRFTDSLQSIHFFPIITKPTRFPPNNISQPSLLDHIWSNSLNVFNSGIISFDATDHCPTFLHLPMPITESGNSNEKIGITFRLNNETNREKFRQLLLEFDWLSLASDNPNDYVENFSLKIDNLYCSTFPLKTKYISKRKALNPWFTPDLKGLINRKSTYFNLMRCGAITKEENNTFKNRIKSVIRKAKNDYYKNLFERNTGNIKETWKLLNEVMDRDKKSEKIKCILDGGVEIENDQAIADIFGEYFHKVPLDLDAGICDTGVDPLSFLSEPSDSLLVTFEPCTPMECYKIIKDMKITKQNLNSIPVRLFVSNGDILSLVICDMINRAMGSGIFPDLLKVARVVPIYKKGDARNPSNYRPISLLPYLSKIYEKIIYSRLLNHLDNNNIISPCQFGFRKGISTLDAIIHFTEFIYNALNAKKSIANFLIDYSKAFDTVNHQILLRKLEYYGLRSRPLQLLASYLRNRLQYVSIGNVTSCAVVSNISVPQGSILGPLLFLVYVNEIPILSNKFFPTSFADDCTLSMANANLDKLVVDCNSELMRFRLWSDSNRLTLNIDKTNCMLISNSFDLLPDDAFKINDRSLSLVTEARFLGVVVDHKLKYDKHIQYIRGKISKSIGILYRIRSIVPTQCLRNLYFSIIHPYYLYCLPIYGATYATHLEPLKLLQKRAIRVISSAGFLDSTTPLFYSNGILKFEDLYKYSLACYIYSNQHILNAYERPHHYPTRNRDLYIEPLERLRSSQQSVIFNAIKIWNCIPADIKACNSKDSFKFRLRNHFLSQYAPEP